MKKLLVILFMFSTLLVAHPVFTSPEANYNQPARADSAHGFNVISYDISLDIDDQNEFIEGTVIANIFAEEILTEISFELEQFTVNSVFLDENEVD